MFRAILPEFIRSPTLLYLAGFLRLFGGLALVLTHNIWVLDWRLIIALVGWVNIVRVVVTIFQCNRSWGSGLSFLSNEEDSLAV